MNKLNRYRGLDPAKELRALDYEIKRITREIKPVTDSSVADDAAIAESKLAFDSSSGHDHDGSNSAAVAETSLTFTDNETNNVTSAKHGFQAKDAYALAGIVIYTSGSGTYTPTTGTRAINIKCLGGGGGGGGAAYGAGAVGAAGGGVGGGYAEKFIDSPAASYAYAVGAGGGGGAAGANAGTVGGDTTFGSPAIITAKGGSGGAAGTAYAPPVIYDGGASTTGTTGGDINIQGGLSGIRFSLNTTYLVGARGGDSPLGRGGRGSANGAVGEAGQNYGGGGGGASAVASTNRAGGAGAGGIIIIYEYK